MQSADGVLHTREFFPGLLVEFVDGQPQAPVLLSTPDMPASISAFGFDPNGDAFYIFTDGDDARGLAHVALSGGAPAAPVQISEALPADHFFQMGPVGEWLGYSAGVAGDIHVALIGFDQDGPLEPRTVFEGFDAGLAGGLIGIELPEVGRRLIVQGSIDGTPRVASVDLDDPALTPAWLDDGLPAGWKSSFGVTLSPDEQQAFIILRPIDGTDEMLMRVPVDGSGPLQQLTPGGSDIFKVYWTAP